VSAVPVAPTFMPEVMQEEEEVEIPQEASSYTASPETTQQSLQSEESVMVEEEEVSAPSPPISSAPAPKGALMSSIFESVPEKTSIEQSAEEPQPPAPQPTPPPPQAQTAQLPPRNNVSHYLRVCVKFET
jgi:hypothetical protein